MNFREAQTLEPLTLATRAEALAFVARRPFENAMLQWILEGGAGTPPIQELRLVRDADGPVRAVAYLGPLLFIAAETDEAIAAVAAEARHLPGLRSCTGAQSQVERLWRAMRDGHRAPTLVRANQPLYVLEPARLVEPADPVSVRQATLADAEMVIENSAQMMLGELGYDPRESRLCFASSVRRTILRGNWWICVHDGELDFQLNVGPSTRATVQLQGVWTPAHRRKRGIATAALGGIAARLLQTCPTVSLYVNDFNRDAIALYERVGFRRVSTMSTLLFN